MQKIPRKAAKSLAANASLDSLSSVGAASPSFSSIPSPSHSQPGGLLGNIGLGPPPSLQKKGTKIKKVKAAPSIGKRKPSISMVDAEKRVGERGFSSRHGVIKRTVTSDMTTGENEPTKGENLRPIRVADDNPLSMPGEKGAKIQKKKEKKKKVNVATNAGEELKRSPKNLSMVETGAEIKKNIAAPSVGKELERPSKNLPTVETGAESQKVKAAPSVGKEPERPSKNSPTVKIGVAFDNPLCIQKPKNGNGGSTGCNSGSSVSSSVSGSGSGPPPPPQTPTPTPPALPPGAQAPAPPPPPLPLEGFLGRREAAAAAGGAFFDREEVGDLLGLGLGKTAQEQGGNPPSPLAGNPPSPEMLEEENKKKIELMLYQVSLFAFTDEGRELAMNRGFPSGWSCFDDESDGGKRYYTAPSGQGFTKIHSVKNYLNGNFEQIRRYAPFPLDPLAASDALEKGLPKGWFLTRRPDSSRFNITAANAKQYTSLNSALTAIKNGKLEGEKPRSFASGGGSQDMVGEPDMVGKPEAIIPESPDGNKKKKTGLMAIPEEFGGDQAKFAAACGFPKGWRMTVSHSSHYKIWR